MRVRNSEEMRSKRGNSLNVLGRTGSVFVATVIAMGLISACASVEATKAPEDVVRQLANQRWKALVAGDFSTAYMLAAPSYRAIKSMEVFRGSKQGAVKWIGAEVLRVDCSEAKCSVQVELESKFMVPIQIKGTVKSAIEETWVLEGGKWWMFEKL